mmetsp:Transcript_29061/g.52673  ORF Transcript_29061/g.52673 Transcript_29061/m.52673 type:complete len:438 (-) Transcript_29061:68-1381(-)|eukprot:CAMPEP_0197622558 /NCGR_PEP_ID=MMETSP1338-20131121/2814_1 /TAXON_ID=43686 ORGANISM="Pelagodinium beii, Strain RCC1491" /NCGR_SAMPLE_ID=MMETSP1338 /ASSEMBLY_ACC=CAM_ASM_000754 /LENGTH=437 /DNA_ID=CAMNT_0043192299 /DNA_START=108 /DNA_END=1421 /DNA_ORIENTATION=-
MASSGRIPADASNSVAVHFLDQEFPRSLEEATEIFGGFGDVARLDTTLGAVTGLVFATYFDVRCALKVLQHFGPRAEPLQPAAYDFRSICIPTSVFAALPESFAGFQSFGEIAGVSVSGEDMIVDFYDIRAAQQASCLVHGSRPKKMLWPKDGSMPDTAASMAPQEPQHIPMPQSLISVAEKPQGQPQVPEERQLRKTPASTGPVSQGPGKPFREKVNTQDLCKFDIIPEKIRSGRDSRTTVMVRNIPKACTREAFVELLAPLGLGERYTFFYMPFDKRRNIHCGFAFINFQTPEDVLHLYERLTVSFWRRACTNHPHHAAVPAVSYGRLQGQEQLMKHFSLSAVMHDTDARKRPVFCQEEQQTYAPQANLRSRQKDFGNEEDFADLESVVTSVLQDSQDFSFGIKPYYTSTSGGKDEDPASAAASLAFLMSHGSGA